MKEDLLTRCCGIRAAAPRNTNVISFCICDVNSMVMLRVTDDNTGSLVGNRSRWRIALPSSGRRGWAPCVRGMFVVRDSIWNVDFGNHSISRRKAAAAPQRF